MMAPMGADASLRKKTFHARKAIRDIMNNLSRISSITPPYSTDAIQYANDGLP